MRRTRAVLYVTVAVLSGAATAACGPISFLGLVVPHLARLLCGPDYRWILAYTVVLTPIVLLLADITGRVVMSPDELQAGGGLGAAGDLELGQDPGDIVLDRLLGQPQLGGDLAVGPAVGDQAQEMGVPSAWPEGPTAPTDGAVRRDPDGARPATLRG